MNDPRPGTVEQRATGGRCLQLLLGGCLLLCGAGVALFFVGRQWLRQRLISAPMMEHTLEGLHAAQEQFKRVDPDQDGPDYGTLEELARSRAIGEHLEDGEVYGYSFQLALTPARDGWLIVANPLDERARYPSFAVGTDGKVMASRSRLALTPDCSVPPGLDLAERIPDYLTWMAPVASSTR